MGIPCARRKPQVEFQIPRRDLLGWGAALAGAAASGPVLVSEVQAQPQKPFRIGVVHEGGEYSKMVDGLKDGLRDLGLEAGRKVLLDVRAVEGDRAAAGDSARSLEQANVALICSLGSSVTVAAKGATTKIPIVFVIGGDPLAFGLVNSLARPDGRLTGVRCLSVDLTAKRFEILKEALPTLRIDAARSKRLPTMVSEPSLVARGALLGYGVNFYDVGRLAAKYIQRSLAGTDQGRLPIESVSTYGLGVNLKTAREIGITIPQSVLFRAEQVVE